MAEKRKTWADEEPEDEGEVDVDIEEAEAAGLNPAEVLRGKADLLRARIELEQVRGNYVALDQISQTQANQDAREAKIKAWESEKEALLEHCRQLEATISEYENKEPALNEAWALVHKAEAEIGEREAAVEAKEAELNEREANVSQRERRCHLYEDVLPNLQQ